MKYWVVCFDCDEAVIRTANTASEAAMSDDLGCLPVAVYRPEAVVLKSDPWMSDGSYRCTVVEATGEPAWTPSGKVAI